MTQATNTTENTRFILQLRDRKGNPLNEGDIVKISNGREFTFFSEVKWLKEEKAIAPFHTFSFHSFEKVDKVPNHAKASTETRYKIWYSHNPEKDDVAKEFEGYLMDWRACEHILETSCFTLEPVK